MANAFSTDANASGKLYSSFMPYSPPVLVAGLVQHELVAGPTQLTILCVVDETGSASLGDIAAALGDHPDPTGAVLVMVDLEILVIDYAEVIDQHSVVRRAPDTSGPVGMETETRCPGTKGSGTQEAKCLRSMSDATLPEGIEQLPTSSLVPAVVVAAGEARRGLGKLDALNRPGIYALVGERQIYIGASASVGTRVASGQQPIGDIQHIVVITDANDTLCDDDARAAERMFFARIEATRAFAVMNELPMGAAIDPQRYSELDAFLGQVCLALRHHGVMFTHGTARAVLSGPRQEAGRVAPQRPFNEMPDGARMELCFDSGLVALASRQSDNRWIVLQGSDIRIDTAASANSSVRFLRSAWLHAGLLDLSADGRSFVTTRDLVFRSGSGAAQFCVGSKGRTRDSWVAIDPGGGFDAATPALIAA